MNTLIIGVGFILQENLQHAEMTAGGWVFMIAAWVFILTLTFYTFSKILKGNK
jgi:hypothetical protein